MKEDQHENELDLNYMNSDDEIALKFNENK